MCSLDFQWWWLVGWFGGIGVVVSICVWVCDCFDLFQFGYWYVVVPIWVWVCDCFDLF